MRELKSRLPCKACGKLGHWKDDDACPRKSGGRNVHDTHIVSIFMVKAGNPDVVIDIALVDTACAKSVCGRPWAPRGPSTLEM